MTPPLEIRYRFDLPDGSQKHLHLKFIAAEFRLLNAAPAEPPFWTELKFSQCANCPLSPDQHKHCPAALQMAPVIESLKALVSFDTIGVTVLQAERKTYAEMSAQQALSSVLGLIMATAGCPWTDRLRPMARFHLPFANEAETVYRSVCSFLLARELMGTGKAAWICHAQGAVREPAHRQSRHVAPLGRGHAHRSCAQRHGAARFVHDPSAGRAGVLAGGTQAAV